MRFNAIIPIDVRGGGGDGLGGIQGGLEVLVEELALELHASGGTNWDPDFKFGRYYCKFEFF